MDGKSLLCLDGKSGKEKNLPCLGFCFLIALRVPGCHSEADSGLFVGAGNESAGLGKGGRKQQLLRVNHQLFLGIIALYKVSPFIKGPIFVDYIFGKSSVAVGTTNLEK